jgi:hypothetical protein
MTPTAALQVARLVSARDKVERIAEQLSVAHHSSGAATASAVEWLLRPDHSRWGQPLVVPRLRIDGKPTKNEKPRRNPCPKALTRLLRLRRICFDLGPQLG